MTGENVLDDIEVDEAPCEHAHIAEQSGYPEYSGRCAVYAVCEDCGENLGECGYDSVL